MGSYDKPDKLEFLGLNIRLKKRFLLAPIAVVFAQGFTDELLDRLMCRDPETSKLIFQLMIDVL